MGRKQWGEYQVGDHVEYEAVGGGSGTTTSFTTGVIEDIITHDEEVPAGRRGEVHVHAQADHPRFLIRNDRTGKEVPYKPENIKGKLRG